MNTQSQPHGLTSQKQTTPPDPKTITGMSYADAAAKVFHMLITYEPVLCHDNKNY